jgi:hypothetical protein
MRRIGMLCCALVACVAVPMTIIRSNDTAGATKARDQTPVRLPPVQREPTILRPSNEKGPFRLPTYVVPEKEEHKDLTAHRPPAGSEY